MNKKVKLSFELLDWIECDVLNDLNGLNLWNEKQRRGCRQQKTEHVGY